MTDSEFRALLNDNKRIEGNIKWKEDPDHSPGVEFRVSVLNTDGYPLVVHGRFNATRESLTFAMICKAQCIYRLDFGHVHRNPPPGREMMGEKHKHKWEERYKDRYAYEPNDITEQPSNPVAVWEQFCREANIKHNGRMLEPPELDRLIVI